MKPDIIATVACITVVCYLIGMACKATGKLDKWIPCIVGAAGAVLGVVDGQAVSGGASYGAANAGN